MKMRVALTALFSVFALFMMSMHGWLSMTPYERAVVYGAKVRTVYEVVDDRGRPVPDVKVHVSLDFGFPEEGEFVYDGYTDRDGRYVLDGKTTGTVRYRFVKDGYYETSGEMNVYDIDDKQNAVKDGKWQPYGETQRIVLKRIVNPVARPFHYDDFPVPVFGQWMGLDLERFELCPPYGKGVHKDVLLRYVLDVDPAIWDKTYASMELSFTNNPHAGAYVLKKDKWSDFQSCHVADTNSAFSIKTFKYERFQTREGKSKDERFPEDSYIVFRTRTAVDRDGNLVSAHYGKIYGGFGYPRYVHFEGTLFNSNPNDPNLEDEESGRRAGLLIKGMRESGGLK